MHLIAIWHNATRTRTERTRFELEVVDYTIETFVGMEQAFHAYNVHYSIAHQQPHTDWRRITDAAIQFAGRNLTPWERQHLCVSLKFVP